MSASVVITAGFARSPAASALAQLLLSDGVRIAGVLIVTPFQVARARRLVASRGMSGLKIAMRRALGRRLAGREDGPHHLREFYRSERLEEVALPELCRRHDIACRRVRSLNGEGAIAFVQECRATGAMYCGGGILSRAFLEACHGRVLNAHAGPLPQVRGMNAAEWSLLLDLEPQVTIHFIDEGIDTGPAVDRLPIPRTPEDTIYSFRERSVVVGIEGLRKNVGALASPVPSRAPDSSSYRQVFVLAPALAEIAARRLREARGPSQAATPNIVRGL